MKTLLKLAVLIALILGAYLYFVPGASVSDVFSFVPKPKKIDPATGRPLIECPRCKGVGKVNCAARGCVEGKIECNGPCLRLTKGTWFKDEKLGHGPDELWIAFREKGGTQYWTKGHVGEVVEMRDGKAVIAGKCPVCQGTTRMPCKICGGSAQVACPVCKGQKEIPDIKSPAPGIDKSAQEPQDAVSSPVSPEFRIFRLKDGREITGKIVIRDVDVIVVRTADGESIHINTAEIVEN